MCSIARSHSFLAGTDGGLTPWRDLPWCPRSPRGTAQPHGPERSGAPAAKTVRILGYGDISRALSSRVPAISMRVLATQRRVPGSTDPRVAASLANSEYAALDPVQPRIRFAGRVDQCDFRRSPPSAGHSARQRWTEHRAALLAERS